MSRIRFHLDENVDPAVADGLRRRGVDVTTTPQSGLLHASDDQQLSFSTAEKRILVTHNEDFLNLAKSGVPHFGIAYCKLGTRTVGQLIAALLMIRDCLTIDEMQNHVEFLWPAANLPPVAMERIYAGVRIARPR